MCSVQTLTVGILAGGQGVRLGGRDKGMLVLDGEPLVAQLMASVHRNLDAVPELSCIETIINCPRNSLFYRHYAQKLLCDRQLHEGPAAGIAALLAACTTDWLLIVACDQRPLPAGSVKTLFGAARRHSANHNNAGSYATDQGRHTPCLLINRAKAVAWTPTNSVLQAIEGLGLTPAEIPGCGADIDTLQDLAGPAS